MILQVFVLLRIKNRSQMHYVFISMLSLLVIWNVGAILAKYSHENGYDMMGFVTLSFIGTCFVPVSALFMGIIFFKTKIKFKIKHLLVYVIPVTSMILLLTNNYHKLFFVKFTYLSKDIVYGKYFVIHAVYSYICILVGLFYLVYISVKNSGIFSKQSILILSGCVIPLIVSVMVTFQIVTASLLLTPISFSFATICYYIAIFKYDFLKVLPIAMQTVVDKISNSFVVIDMQLRIVDYNRAMVDTFKDIVEFKRKDDILEILDVFKPINISVFKGYIEQAHETGKAYLFEHRFFIEGKIDEYFMIEITPIIRNKNSLGTMILLTNITEHKEDLRIIKEQQQQIIEKERLASLGTLMGGISHNLKTPIMSIVACITVLEDLVNEYDESIGISTVNESDHHEIASEMLNNLKDLKGHISYISGALNAMKGQVISPESRGKDSFTLEEMVKNIEFLMKYEVKANLCSMSISNEVGDCKINGNSGTLVQIINNLISNSIQAYEKNTHSINIDASKRKIELIISKDQNYIIFQVKDYGKGIPQEVKDKLFKEMTTTKGKDGSGIGLYLSYSKVKGMFNGDMWLESQEGKGTTVFVKVKPE